MLKMPMIKKLKNVFKTKITLALTMIHSIAISLYRIRTYNKEKFILNFDQQKTIQYKVKKAGGGGGGKWGKKKKKVN